LHSSNEQGAAEVAARTAFHSIDETISQYAELILFAKTMATSTVTGDRANLALSSVSQKVLDNFIDNMVEFANFDHPDSELSHSEVKLFKFLRTTSISADNVQSANMYII
jgi:hypothetical protein